ncbi:Heat shock factor binding 1 [Corchorus olitorius]|uniref:Heat shock factor binding 1 n=1 Tax=Corchorus olitorius TaxID=93759 RepID=A0A1R3JU98_9ROSI|nr:Heat shock factor binding 1 [Corchorus olitorius]
MDGNDSVDQKQSTADMTVFVQNLLQQMQSRKENVLRVGESSSLAVVSQLPPKANRIDELEQSINDLRAEMGADNSPSPSVPPAPKDDSKSPNES